MKKMGALHMVRIEEEDEGQEGLQKKRNIASRKDERQEVQSRGGIRI